jgi:hypothetical protein
MYRPQSRYRGRVEIGGSVSAHSAGVYTTTSYELVNIEKGGGRARPNLTRLGLFVYGNLKSENSQDYAQKP